MDAREIQKPPCCTRHQGEQRGAWRHKLGGDRSWDHVDVSISCHEYDDYIDAYARRLRRLHEDTLEKTCPNYWSRRLLLDKFDDWKDGWHGDYPWEWHFEEIKEKRHGKIRTPAQFIKIFTACAKFVAAEFEKDPNYEPPDEVAKFIFFAKDFLEKQAGLPANIVLVTDPDYTVTNLYGLRWDAPHETAYPSAFVLDKKGLIVFEKISHSHGDRLSAEDALKNLPAHQ